MKRRTLLLMCVIALCFIFDGCGIKNYTIKTGTTVEKSVDIEKTINDASTNQNEEIDKDEKLNLSQVEKLNYNGYMDEVDENWFGTKYEISDYDKDGINDRVYRSTYRSPESKKNADWPDTISYRIDFGNGENLEIGTFDDAFLGIKIIGADLTGDGVNEIIFLGHHDALTNPESYSEIAVYKKNNMTYERIKLRNPNDEALTSNYIVGYPVYAKNDTGSEITLYSDYVDYEETIHIDRTDYNRDEKYNDNDIISYIAWGDGTENIDDKTGLVLYQSIGGRNYYNNNLKITLIWENNEFQPAKMEVVDKHYEW